MRLWLGLICVCVCVFSGCATSSHQAATATPPTVQSTSNAKAPEEFFRIRTIFLQECTFSSGETLEMLTGERELLVSRFHGERANPPGAAFAPYAR